MDEHQWINPERASFSSASFSFASYLHFMVDFWVTDRGAHICIVASHYFHRQCYWELMPFAKFLCAPHYHSLKSDRDHFSHLMPARKDRPIFDGYYHLRRLTTYMLQERLIDITN